MKTILLLFLPILGYSQDTLKSDLKIVKTYDLQGKELKSAYEDYHIFLGMRLDLMSDGTIRKRISLNK